MQSRLKTVDGATPAHQCAAMKAGTRPPEVRRLSHRRKGSFPGHLISQWDSRCPWVSGTSYGPHILDPRLSIQSSKLSLGLKQESQPGTRGLRISELVGYVFVAWEISHKNLPFLLALETEVQATSGLRFFVNQPSVWRVVACSHLDTEARCHLSS